MLRVGILSDTHGLLRAEASAFLAGCDRIVHGGDIGTQGILDELERIAPVTAVRGNNDKGPWANGLPETAHVRLGEVSAYVIHDLSQLDIDPEAADIHVVISGHSHRPLIEQRDGVLYLNPGSAGPRRFKLPIAVAQLEVDGRTMTPRIVTLTGSP